MEYFDEYNELGEPTGRKVLRSEAHRLGLWHKTVHIWVKCKNQLLIQKRSQDKDSYPGMFDISSAGHISYGEDVYRSAIREVEEELGISVKKEDLKEIGHYKISYDKEFHNEMFRDRELATVYLLEVNTTDLDFHIQKEELDEVLWMDMADVKEHTFYDREHFCLNKNDYNVLEEYLNN